MAWRRPGDKPLSEAMMDSLWRIYASLGLNELKEGQRPGVWVNEIKKMKLLYDVYCDSKSKLWILWTT